MATKTPDDPTRPARKSVAGVGSVADCPDDITRVTVGDTETTHGILIRWDAGEWFYAENDGSYCSLDDSL